MKISILKQVIKDAWRGFIVKKKWFANYTNEI